MPTYEYKCVKCGYIFEKFQNITESPYKKCPSCKGPVKRLISGGAGIIFKGNGFHATDYRSRGYKEAAKKEKDTCPRKKNGKCDLKGGTCGG